MEKYLLENLFLGRFFPISPSNSLFLVPNLFSFDGARPLEFLSLIAKALLHGHEEIQISW